MLIIPGIVAAARLRLLAFPLARAEGAGAGAGQLLLQGIPPPGWCPHRNPPRHNLTLPAALQSSLRGSCIERKAAPVSMPNCLELGRTLAAHFFKHAAGIFCSSRK
ncbi:MAG: hypothetical protein P4N60_16355 [Verrucomicrobiae bacterium]|nr:hypothetical protein [Verrucomicrobiae bacterium]